MMDKATLLSPARSFGLFAVARRSARPGVRILCYHGLALPGSDELRFRDKMFISVDIFAARMAWLAAQGYNVLSLDEALAHLHAGTVPPRAVVITFDEGFESFETHAAPILSRYGFPASVFVTTYYVKNRNPVFRLAVQYLLWKADRIGVTLGDVDAALASHVVVPERNWRADAARAVYRHAETSLTEQQRSELLGRLGRQLGVDYQDLVTRRFLNLMSLDSIARMDAAGFDMQLHTHRHILPMSRDGVIREIEDNRATLQPAVTRPLQHLAYPSGVWAAEQFPWLAQAAVKSAGTTEFGLNLPGQPVLALRRFIDSQAISAIDFEAELSGVNDIHRNARWRLLRMRGLPIPSNADAADHEDCQ